MFVKNLFIALLLLAILPQCRVEEELTRSSPVNVPPANVPPADTSPADLSVLFVGNSLTYVNDLPYLVIEIAAMDGVKLKATTIARGDYSLEDHWNDGSIQTKLGESKYDFLIGQQGPSALPESQRLLKDAAMLIASECSKTGTRFGLYMVWPSLDRDFDRDNSILSYTNAAKASGALLCPAGLAWKKAWAKDAGLKLYGPDNFHPGIRGSVLAAMVIYASIREKSNLDFIVRSKASWTAAISDDELSIMKSAALEAIAK